MSSQPNNSLHSFRTNPKMAGSSIKHPNSASVARPGQTDLEPLNPFILSTTHKQMIPPASRIRNGCR